MTSKVAVIEFDGCKAEPLKQAIDLISGIDDLNTPEKTVVVKVGVFSHQAENHTSVSVVESIINSFNRVPKIILAESDNYRGDGLERLQIWKELFTERVVPFNLSNDPNTKNVRLADQQMSLSHILFKPNIIVDTHILRSFENGSILKNLFGCIPTPKKMKYHKILPTLLADIYEAIGGIDLAVLDGTYLWSGAGNNPLQMNTLIAGRDAVAVETVGATLAGLTSEEMPVIQEFKKRNLGEADLKNIEIMGASIEHMKKKLQSAARNQRKPHEQRKGPQTWGGHAHHAIESLIHEGFFTRPKKRTIAEVARAMEAKGLPTKGKEAKIANALTRRARKGALKKAKSLDEWVYWTE